MINLSKCLKYGLWAVLLLFTCVVPTGCSSGRGVPVTGSVTLDDKPVAVGTITFLPEDFKEGGVEHPTAKTDIKDGKYSFGAANGPLPGKYKIFASVKQKTGKQIPSDEPPGNDRGGDRTG